MIVKDFTLLFARNIEDKQLAKSMKNIFDSEIPLHKNRFQKPKLVYHKWRYKLKVGDRLE